VTADVPVHGRPRVLIVDDEPAICLALSHMLRRAGFDAVTALNAGDAERALNDTISAMVLDLRVPYMRGDVFFHIATARFPRLRARTIMMSGDISPEAERLAQLTGCPCLWKPFPNDALLGLLRSFFAEPGVTTSSSSGS
jgi:DNA-binding NtrC family response regulator